MGSQRRHAGDADDAKGRCCAACSIVLTLLSGAGLFVVCASGLQAECVLAIDQLAFFEYLQVDSAHAAYLPVLTTRRLFEVLCLVSVAAILASVVGLVGTCTQHKSPVSCWAISSPLAGLVSIACGMQVFQRIELAEPLLTRQVADLCNATHFIRLGSELRCSWAVNYFHFEVPPCGESCQWRANVLRKMEGCWLLPHLCKAVDYEVDGGVCNALPAPGIDAPILYGAALADADCRRACDLDIRCTAYVTSSARRCVLNDGLASAHRSPTWQQLTPEAAEKYIWKGGAIRCYTRTKPLVLSEYVSHMSQLATVTLILGALLSVTALVAWCLMYNLGMRRRGRPTAWQLGVMACCPCCAGSYNEKFETLNEEEDLSSTGSAE